MSVAVVDCAGPHLGDLSSDIVRCLCVKESRRVNHEQFEGPNESVCDACPTTCRQDRVRAMCSFETSQELNLNETPLMFSRSSSMSSLNSFEHHSLHDDASVVSEFSQFASGVVSPSELPDSPTQSISDSLHHFKVTHSHDVTNHSVDANLNDASFSAKDDVFGDGVTPFKEEGTPVEFSRATSLSALTFDQEPLIVTGNDTAVLQGLGILKRAASEGQEEIVNTKVVKLEQRDVRDTLTQFCLSDEEEGEEDMLAACINMGMQGCHKRRKLPMPSEVKQSGPSSSTKCNDLPSGTSQRALSNPFSVTTTGVEFMDCRGVCDDAFLPYNSEGTPERISRVGSQSDLSLLSISSNGKGAQLMNMLGLVKEETDEGTRKETSPSEIVEKDFDDSVSNMSEDCDDILEECIRSGMPKARTS